MDARYIDPFLKSICNTFETMCSLPVTLRKPELKTNNELRTDVAGIVGFSGDAVGTVVLNFSYDTASKIATRFAGAELAEITPDHEDFADAIGELAHMVADGAKSQFQGLDIAISLPNVIVGTHHNVAPSKASPRVVIPCDTDAGSFFVEVGMVLAEEPATAGVH